MATLNGIDISAWQEGIDLSASGVPADFIIAKATEGTDYVSGDCDRQIQQARDAGKRLGVYHFADGDNVTEEAKHFLQHTKGYVGLAIPFLDYEAHALTQGPGWARQWLDIVYGEWGARPPIYLDYTHAIMPSYDIVVQGNYGLWRAGNDGIGGGYRVPDPLDKGRWPFSMMDQYTSNGQLPGYGGRLDLDIFYGDGATWDAYAATNGVTPPPPGPAPTPTPVDYPTYDSAGRSNTGIQKMLKALYGYAAAIDNVFGVGSWTAMQRFLAANWGYNGPIDGVPGYNTWKAIQRWLAARYGYNLGIDGIPGGGTNAAWNRADAANHDAF